LKRLVGSEEAGCKTRHSRKEGIGHVYNRYSYEREKQQAMEA
jgi:hypothetical protein